MVDPHCASVRVFSLGLLVFTREKAERPNLNLSVKLKGTLGKIVKIPMVIADSSAAREKAVIWHHEYKAKYLRLTTYARYCVGVTSIGGV
jgi:hypothetical protein